MHDLLRSQLQALGLDEHTPPTAAQWERLLEFVSLNMLDHQMQRHDQNLKQQLEEVMLLNRVMAAVNSYSDSTKVLHTVCRELAETLDVSHVTCAILTNDRSCLKIAAEFATRTFSWTAVGTRLPIVEESAIPFLLKNRGPIISADVRADGQIAAAGFPLPADQITQAIMLIPLLVKGRVSGIIALNDDDHRQFTKREITLSQNVAAAAGQALENAQLYEQLQHEYQQQQSKEKTLRNQNAYLGALHETMINMMQRLDLHQLLEDIVEQAAGLLGTRHGFLYVLESPERSDPAGVPVMKAGLGIYRHAIGTPMGSPDSLSGRVWTSKQTVLSNQTDQLILNNASLGQFFAGIGCPLRSNGQITGVIGLVHLQENNSFSQEQADLFERFAQLAVLAIDNARLYSAAQEEIAEREKIERNLDSAKKMAESANRAKSSFLARMSHELRTPLTAIIGYSDIMQEELQELELQHLLEDVVRIRRSAQILLELINDVLDLSKIESGEVTMYLQDFDLADLIQEVASVSHPLVKKNKNTFDLQISPYLGMVKTDLVKLRQILLNLISNAAKFTENGVISVTARRMTEGAIETIEIEVVDSGVGIARDQHEAVFEPFIQADGSNTRKYGGTGLGLAISKRYASLLGGDIVLESDPGHGASFTVRLPVLPALEAKSSTTPSLSF